MLKSDSRPLLMRWHNSILFQSVGNARCRTLRMIGARTRLYRQWADFPFGLQRYGVPIAVGFQIKLKRVRSTLWGSVSTVQSAVNSEHAQREKKWHVKLIWIATQAPHIIEFAGGA